MNECYTRESFISSNSVADRVMSLGLVIFEDWKKLNSIKIISIKKCDICIKLKCNLLKPVFC